MVLTFDDYTLDLKLFRLSHKGEPCKLEPQVFDLLIYLVNHRDRVVSRQELMDELWAGKIVTESTLNSRVKAARHAIGDDGQTQKCITTLHRRGYQFIATVEQSDSQTMPSASLSTIEDKTSLAVLPFSHHHCSESIVWVADMFSEDISIQLARLPGFFVISRNSTANYRESSADVTQVGKELGVKYIIDGSIREVGDKLRVSVQLSDAINGHVLWSDRTDIVADKLGEFQDEVIHKIISRIEPELNRAELSSLRQHQIIDLNAWSLYRKAHAILSLKGWSEESFSEAANLLRQAISSEPELAFAHAYLALILALGHLIGLVSDKNCQAEAKQAAEKAIEINNQDTDVLGYAGCAFADLGDYQRGIGMMQRAVELDPSNAQAHAALGAALLRIGDAEGINKIRYGMRISPRDSRLGVWGTMLARGLLSMGKVSEAIEVADYACRCDDKIFLPRLVLAVAQNTVENIDAARDALNDARRIRPKLAVEDISRFAVPKEVDQLKQAGLL